MCVDNLLLHCSWKNGMMLAGNWPRLSRHLRSSVNEVQWTWLENLTQYLPHKVPALGSLFFFQDCSSNLRIFSGTCKGRAEVEQGRSDLKFPRNFRQNFQRKYLGWCILRPGELFESSSKDLMSWFRNCLLARNKRKNIHFILLVLVFSPASRADELIPAFTSVLLTELILRPGYLSFFARRITSIPLELIDRWREISDPNCLSVNTYIVLHFTQWVFNNLIC